MIEESYVSFETSKLLEEAGFDDIPCEWSYNEEGKISVTYTTNGTLPKGHVARPTQALAARWLSEVHRMVVDVTFIPPFVDGDVWQYFVGEMDEMVWPGDFEPSERKYSTYEEALEEGLKRGLELIKN